MTIGNSQAVGHKPEALLSFKPFEGNDAHLKNYWGDIPYIDIDEAQSNPDLLRSVEGLDFVSAVPPCAGLSSLTSNNTTEEVKASRNMWLPKSAEFVLESLQPKVLFGENAPYLASKKGEPVANQLYAIARTHGYSFSLYTTDTILHGIPQARKRSFYFFWKSKYAPIISYYDRDRLSLVDYLDTIPTDATYQDIFNKTGSLQDDPYYKFLRFKFGDNWRGKFTNFTVYGMYSGRPQDMTELVEFMDSIGEEKISKNVARVQAKILQGGNHWDNSPHFMGYNGKDYTNAIQGRIFEWSVHPREDRWVNLREYMHLMGLPDDFQLVDNKGRNAIVQNVPTCTSRDMTLEVMKFLRGELEFSKETFSHQDNIKASTKPSNFVGVAASKKPKTNSVVLF